MLNLPVGICGFDVGCFVLGGLVGFFLREEKLI